MDLQFTAVLFSFNHFYEILVYQTDQQIFIHCGFSSSQGNTKSIALLVFDIVRKYVMAFSLIVDLMNFIPCLYALVMK